MPNTETFIDLQCKLQKGLKIAHINIQGLIHKVDHIELLLKKNDIHVLGISESWLTEDIDNSEIHIRHSLLK